MGALWGVPDFGAKQGSADFELYAPAEPGPYLLWPSALDVKLNAPGRPDFELVFVRSSGGSGAADYGVLDFGIERRQPTDDALAWPRGPHPDATLAMAPFD